MNIKAEQMIVTPEMAEAWLAADTTDWKNRTLRRDHVNKLKADLLSDRFWFTHQGVAIHPDGYVLDGQHRLIAITESKRAARMFVFYYETDDSASDLEELNHSVGTFDTGRARSLADAYKVSGNTWCNTKIVAMARLIAMTELKVNGLSNEDVKQVMHAQKQYLLESDSCLSCTTASAVYGAAFAYCLPIDKRVKSFMEQFALARPGLGGPLFLLQVDAGIRRVGAHVEQKGERTRDQKSNADRLKEFARAIYAIQGTLLGEELKQLKTPTKQQAKNLREWLSVERSKKGLSTPKEFSVS